MHIADCLLSALGLISKLPTCNFALNATLSLLCIDPHHNLTLDLILYVRRRAYIYDAMVGMSRLLSEASTPSWLLKC